MSVCLPLTRRDFLRTSAALGAVAATGSLPLPARQPGAVATKPNLVFVFSDQQSFDMLGAAGNSMIRTPNLDAFARSGVRFTNCYSNYPVCTPFRGMLMTGRHPLHQGAFSNDVPLLHDTGTTFADALNAEGYQTGYVGKWHLLGGDRIRPIPKGPDRHGFDGTFLTDNCTVEYRAGKCYFWNERGHREIFDDWQVYGQTRQAQAFIRQRDRARPFALFLSWHPPHDWGKTADGYYRYDTLPELAEQYDGVDIQLRPAVTDRSDRRREQMRNHMAMCTGVDEAFGRLMQTLREEGLDDNTIVVFTSDHGDMLGAHGATRPKMTAHDYSARVPLLLRLPGGPQSSRASDLLIGSLDLMPTCLGLMGIEPPEEVHGQNLARAIRAGNDDAVESLPLFCLAQPYQWRGVVTRDYLFSFQKNAIEPGLGDVLFDRQNDRDQLENRFADPSSSAVRRELETLTREWMARFEDAPFWEHNQIAQAMGPQWRAGGNPRPDLPPPISALRANS